MGQDGKERRFRTPLLVAGACALTVALAVYKWSRQPTKPVLDKSPIAGVSDEAWANGRKSYAIAKAVNGRIAADRRARKSTPRVESLMGLGPLPALMVHGADDPNDRQRVRDLIRHVKAEQGVGPVNVAFVLKEQRLPDGTVIRSKHGTMHTERLE